VDAGFRRHDVGAAELYRVSSKLVLKAGETFRDDFAFANSDAAILRFPFPFRDDRFMYAVNLEPHGAGGPSAAYEAMFDLDEHYLGEVAEREMVLRADPGRCQVLPHMRLAEWETLEWLMRSFARDYPEDFELDVSGDAWRWVNRPLGIVQDFTFGDAGTLPWPPLEYITRQAQGDFTLMDQRDGNLFLDGGMVTGAADWSLNFKLGMGFQQIHQPVPVAHELGVFDRSLRFLLKLKAEKPMRRVNWGLTVNPRLDMSSENRAVWAPDKLTVTAQNVGRIMCLRVELQTLTRLPRSGAILFGIRTYLLRLEELVLVPKWAKRLHRVLRGLDPEIAAYKGMANYRQTILDYLAPLDDGAATAPGRGPDVATL